MSAFGDLKYPPDFKHFDYVNPNAPKGGVFSHVGATRAFNQNFLTFNSLNSFILKGDGAQGMELTFASLMARAADEPDALYGLAAAANQMRYIAMSGGFSAELRLRRLEPRYGAVKQELTDRSAQTKEAERNKAFRAVAREIGEFMREKERPIVLKESSWDRADHPPSRPPFLIPRWIARAPPASLFSSNRIDLIVKAGRAALPDAPPSRIQLATDATLGVLL